MRESAWRRGWNDAWVGKDARWVVGLSVLADLGVGLLAAILALANVTSLSVGETFLFGAGGAAIVESLAFVGLLVLSFVRAPFRQRDEAWAELDRLNVEPAFPDIELDFPTFQTSMHEFKTEIPENKPPNPMYFGVLRLERARITNRSESNVSVSFRAWLFLAGLPAGYPKGFASMRWADYEMLLGPPGENELDSVINIPARSSSPGNLTFVVPPWIMDKVGDFHESLSDQLLRGAPSGIEITDHISAKTKRFPLLG